MPVLQETRVSVALAPAKPVGLADLGVPLDDATVVKKGRVHEFHQLLAEGAIGRRFQDLKVIAIKTTEAGLAGAKVFVQFEAFGDNTAAVGPAGTFEATFFAGERVLATVASSDLFLPYASFWYANRFVFALPLADFDAADRMAFIATPAEVRIV
ncbi:MULTISPECIES: hypothetical protein [unclassified Xanthobacter]|uniref:hypothetical protein n=1 Tax=unclassified Xanthobacter TaxID=2623496 RepID=UPI001EE06223|nr:MULTISPECIES: hypothetical protein [unclassified Xanthobacter]